MDIEEEPSRGHELPVTEAHQEVPSRGHELPVTESAESVTSRGHELPVTEGAPVVLETVEETTSGVNVRTLFSLF